MQVLTATTVQAITRAGAGQPGTAARPGHCCADGSAVTRAADMVLVVVGARPETSSRTSPGARLEAKGAIAVDSQHADQPVGRVRRRGLRGHPSPAARRDVLAAGHHGPQTGSGRRGERARREPAVRGQPRHPGGEDLRPGRRPLRTVRPRSGRRRVRPGYRRLPGRRPQRLLPRQATASRCTALPATAPPGGCSNSQLFGHRHAEIAKRIDIAAAAIFNHMTVDVVS